MAENKNSNLILLFLYNSKDYNYKDFLNEVNKTSGISIIDTSQQNFDLLLNKNDMQISPTGNFIVHFKDQSKSYKGTPENLIIIKKILTDLNVEFKNNI